jgi:hypothetical protein
MLRICLSQLLPGNRSTCHMPHTINSEIIKKQLNEKIVVTALFCTYININ